MIWCLWNDGNAQYFGIFHNNMYDYSPVVINIWKNIPQAVESIQG